MTDIVPRARAFAETAHAGQTRKDNTTPYITHVAEVAARTERFGGDDEMVAAAWLHDTVEDCGVSFAELHEAFGPRVTGLVREMTDDTSLPKAERKAAQVADAPSKSRDAVLIKLADKTSNVRALRVLPPNWPTDRMRAYLDWAETVVAALPDAHPRARAGFYRELDETRAALGEGRDKPRPATGGGA